MISLQGLILLKLEAFRARDREDVRALISLHPHELRTVRDYLAKQDAELVHRLAEVL